MPHSESYKRILHRMEYYSYLDGLIKRYMYQGGRWDAHIRNCREFILDAVDEARPQHITVLGSGWLLEVPLKELAGRVAKISLIDILHPPDVIRQTSGMKNVELLECDLTGGIIEAVWEQTRGLSILKKEPDLSSLRVPGYKFTEDPGMVISLNVLSQLDALPGKLLREKTKPDENKLKEFRKQVQEKHLELLERYRSVLISDYLEIFTDADGKSTSEETVLAKLPSGRKKAEWTWDFDLSGTDFNRKVSVLKVVAVLF